jgi:N-acetylglutamate synthase
MSKVGADKDFNSNWKIDGQSIGSSSERLKWNFRQFTSEMTRSIQASSARHKQDAIEAAGFCAWPCFEEATYLGWRLRFAKGFTKRANSANAGALAQMLTESNLSDIEDQYRSRGIVSVFRLCASPSEPLTVSSNTASSPVPSFAASSLIVTQVDRLLADQGYRLRDRSIVMACPLTTKHPTAALQQDKSFVTSMQAEQWLSAYYAISAKAATHQDSHSKLLKLMPVTSIFAAIHRDGKPVSCGIGVLNDGHLGLFEITTHSGYRGQGLATELCRHLLSSGRAQGAHTAYLQVEAVNHEAIRLYEALGFSRQYEYWYRVAEK